MGVPDNVTFIQYKDSKPRPLERESAAIPLDLNCSVTKKTLVRFCGQTVLSITAKRNSHFTKSLIIQANSPRELTSLSKKY